MRHNHANDSNYRKTGIVCDTKFLCLKFNPRYNLTETIDNASK